MEISMIMVWLLKLLRLLDVVVVDVYVVVDVVLVNVWLLLLLVF